MTRVVVVGGYGFFGARVVERLARGGTADIVIAGRSDSKAALAAETLRRAGAKAVSHCLLDATAPDGSVLTRLQASVLINASGPFQGQDYALARACIGAGVHYVDLADARGFVTGIAALDAEARRANVLVVSGASSVPSLAAAVVDKHLPMFAKLESIEHGISPANSYDPGAATIASIVGGLGKPFVVTVRGERGVAYGWQGLTLRRLPGLGTRFFSVCDVPDHDVLVQRYPSVRTVQFRAGLEVAAFHLGLWLLSWPSRMGVMVKPERIAGPLLWAKRRLSIRGSDRGGMYMILRGQDASGHELVRTWTLVAGRGHGPYVPATPSVIMARKLAGGRIAQRGAMACAGFFTLDEVLVEMADLDIATTLV